MVSKVFWKEKEVIVTFLTWGIFTVQIESQSQNVSTVAKKPRETQGLPPTSEQAGKMELNEQ